MTSVTLESGLALIRKKNYRSVHSSAINALKRNKLDPLPYFLLGVIASEHQNQVKAFELFSKAVELDDGIVDFHVHLAKTLSALGRQNLAKAQADIAANFATDDIFMLDTLGVIYSRSGYHELAIPLFEKVVSQSPEQANYYFNLGASAQFIGDFGKSKSAYENTVRLDPTFYRAWSSLVSLTKQTQDDNHLDTLMELFESSLNDAEGQLQLGHSIAKTLEDLGRHEESFEWLTRGKSKKRKQLRYNRKAGLATFDAAKLISSGPNEMANHYSDASPIFIVGLPRTGTTLVDRILSSHSDVISAGELNIFAELVKRATETDSHLVLDADTFLSANEIDIASVGKTYIQMTSERAKGSKCMIDKMPLNFFYAALIHKALPNARIIALRRGAMDSCLSNYRQLFSTEYSYYNYTFDIEDTAWFYRQFHELMAHWRGALPASRFMEIHYEDIVFDQENQTRKLLKFCGLSWQEACLRFHENAAPVSTASSVQVRQPLYSGSIGRWKKYGRKLDQLKTALGDLTNQTASRQTLSD